MFLQAGGYGGKQNEITRYICRNILPEVLKSISCCSLKGLNGKNIVYVGPGTKKRLRAQQGFLDTDGYLRTMLR